MSLLRDLLNLIGFGLRSRRIASQCQLLRLFGQRLNLSLNLCLIVGLCLGGGLLVYRRVLGGHLYGVADFPSLIVGDVLADHQFAATQCFIRVTCNDFGREHVSEQGILSRERHALDLLAVILRTENHSI